METYIVIAILVVLICTHFLTYNIGKLVMLNKYTKELDILKDEMDKIKAIKMR